MTTTNTLSDVLERSILEYYLTTAATTANVFITRPTSWWVSLHTDSGSDETNAQWYSTELKTSAALNYTRAAIGWISATTTGSKNIFANSASVAFTSANANWASVATSVAYIGVWDNSAVSAGNLLFWVDTNNINVLSTDVVTIASSAITLELQ